MGQPLNSEIERFLQSLNDVDHGGETDQDEMETVDVYFVRREAEIEPQGDIVDAIPAQSTGPSALVTMAVLFFCLGILFSSIALQIFLGVNPPVATITIVPSVRTMTLNGTLPLGRLTHAITLFQTQTDPTTGMGHQDARAATGTITFYNASFSSQVVGAGSVFVGTDGIQIQTDTTIAVPANNPPQDGIASVAAHAVTAGSHGNIQALDINSAASSSLFIKNLAAFAGGQDERTFSIVTRRDIDTAAAPMKPVLAHSIQGALETELKPNEELLALPCEPSVKSDHQPGDEASRVQVTVSETCNGVALDVSQLKSKAALLLSHQAGKELGAGYSLVGDIQVTDIRAIFPHMAPMIMFSSCGLWAYGLTNAAQERMKKAIAGKSTGEALHILSALPGVRSASTSWDANTKLAKDARYIHFIIVIPGA